MGEYTGNSSQSKILVLNNKYVNPYLGQNSPKKQIFQRYNIYFSESNSQNIKATTHITINMIYLQNYRILC